MPERALHPCAKHGCAGLTRQRFCDAHAHLQREYETASLDRLREIRKPPEVSALYASRFSAVNKTLTAGQRAALVKLRNLDVVPEGAYRFSTPVAMPQS